VLLDITAPFNGNTIVAWVTVEEFVDWLVQVSIPVLKVKVVPSVTEVQILSQLVPEVTVVPVLIRVAVVPVESELMLRVSDVPVDAISLYQELA